MVQPTLLRRLLRQELESLHRSGVRDLPRSTQNAAGSLALHSLGPTHRVDPADSPRHDSAAGGKPIEHTGAKDEALGAEQAEHALGVLRQEVAGCTLCTSLAETRTQTVFGVGNARARLVFFGEAPGADEDRQGEPFVGRAGQLLTRIIEACGMKREDVYILNVLKCRPPGNRNPTPEEAQNCRPYFQRQIEIIDPEFICCLGAIAASTLLETTVSIGRLRGQFHDWRGIRVMATYHPAYLLRNPAAKRLVWEDMKMLMKAMGRKIPR